MNDLERRIRQYIMKINPEKLDLTHPIKKVTIQKLGLGESNLNYLVEISGKKFVFRINMDPGSPNKSQREYTSLKNIENLGIAPKVFHIESSKKYLGESFIILGYTEGKSFGEIKDITDNIIRELGRIIAKLHNTDYKNIENHFQRYGYSIKGILDGIEGRIDYIKKKRRLYFNEDEFEKILENSQRNLKRLKINLKSNLVLGHGDLDPQNVIYSCGKLKLIDWEDLGLIDPALEIAGVFDAFDFSNRQRDLFLEGYLEVRKDRELRVKIKNFWPFQLFRVFCWAIMHVYEIGEGEMHEYFIREKDLKDHISYAKKMFLKCKKEGIINRDAKWNPSEIFPEKFGLSA
jgi:thiamine kinase-like enzyme